jgi:hypothetical protein
LYILPGVVATAVIPALRRLRQKDHEFEANQGYTSRPCLKKTKNRTLYKLME